MKIAHIVSTFPPHVGGMGQVCFEEAKLLAKEHQVTVFTLAYTGKEYQQDDLTFSIRRMRPLFQFGDAGWLIGLKKELPGFDLVHLHYPFYGVCGSLIKAKKLLGFPLIITYHMDVQSVGLKKFLAKIYDFFYARKLIAIADKVIGVDAEYFKRSKYGRLIGKEKSVILPNGVDTDFFTPGQPDSNRQPLRRLDNKKIILFVGNLLPVKNLDLLINILPQMPEEVCLLVAGGGYDEARYRQMVKDKNLDGRICFVSDFSQEDLRDFYRAADLVAAPSLSESFSLVALSAMSCGAIVAGSDIPGLRGRIKNNIDGYILPVNDSDAWLIGIKKILNLSPEARREICEKARNKAKNFSLDKHAAQLNEIYSSIVSF